MKTKFIRVLVVDDSALARRVILRSLGNFADIEIVGTAADPYEARAKILELNPDVITLDIEMPRMDGITFLKLIMRHRPMPVVIMSSLTAAGSEKAMEALQAGAIEVMEKPGGSYSAHQDGTRLAEKIRVAAGARVFPRLEDAVAAEARQVRPPRPAQVAGPGRSDGGIILLGASTGGTEALKTVLTSLSGNLPGICIVQHIPAFFSRAFAERLNRCCPMEVREAAHGDEVKPGLALVAPGGSHMLVKRRSGHYVVELSQGPLLHYQRPAVDILFDSAVKAGVGPRAIAAVLTGMGADGAAGLLRLREAGAATIAQNEDTCVVFGMPREAIRLGAARHILPLPAVAPCLEQWSAAGTEYIRAINLSHQP